MNSISKERIVRLLVQTAVAAYADGFQARHESEVNNPNGTINMKVHNVFIKALGKDVQYYAALVRSLDSSLGNMLEKLAINITEISFDVQRKVSGPLLSEQTQQIAELLEKYKRREFIPSVNDYQSLRTAHSMTAFTDEEKRHESDYYLTDRNNGNRYLIELKIGGDLDNKKARSEKEAILEQFAILSNTLPSETKIQIFFATAYNRFGENQPWKQERVRQFFADDELLIGSDFWNFICQDNDGYQWVLSSYRENASLIKKALQSIRHTYLGE